MHVDGETRRLRRRDHTSMTCQRMLLSLDLFQQVKTFQPHLISALVLGRYVLRHVDPTNVRSSVLSQFVNSANDGEFTNRIDLVVATAPDELHKTFMSSNRPPSLCNLPCCLLPFLREEPCWRRLFPSWLPFQLLSPGPELPNEPQQPRLFLTLGPLLSPCSFCHCYSIL